MITLLALIRLIVMRQYRELLQLNEEQRSELKAWAQSRTLPAGDVFRARLILALAEGFSYAQIKEKLQTSAPTISRWKQRFEQDGMAGLDPRHRGSRPRVANAQVQARIARKTQQKPSDGSTHWSCRKMAEALGVSKSTVQRVWAQARLKPHRLDRYMASNDPQFEEKATDIIGLYMNPPQHAAVFCVDEKTAIQALDRLDPVLPLSPGRAERHGFEYYRHGTLSLYAALDVKTGKVHGMTAARHTSQEFILVPGRTGGTNIVGETDPRRAGQSFGAQDQRRSTVPPQSSSPAVSLHADLLVVAESGGTLVCQDPARRDCARRVHFGLRSGQQTTQVHSRLFEISQAVPMDLHGPESQNHS